ncbi:hypothetical protein ACVXG7_31150 [Enterobacter hormaechei]
MPLIMALIMFDNLNDREFSGSAGTAVLYADLRGVSGSDAQPETRRDPAVSRQTGSGDDMLNRLLWNLLLSAPLAAMLAAAVGYLATSQALLARLETSVAIWFLLLVVYHVIRRGMLVQRVVVWRLTVLNIVAQKFWPSARSEEEPNHVNSTERIQTLMTSNWIWMG